MTTKTISVALRPRLLRHIGQPLLDLHPVPRSRTVATIIHAHAGRIDLHKLADQLPVLERLEWQMNNELQRTVGVATDPVALAKAVQILHALCPR
jgi:hypothetical protein